MQTRNIYFAAFFAFLVIAFSVSNAAAQGLNPSQRTETQPSTDKGPNQESVGAESATDAMSVQDLVKERVDKIIRRGTDMSFEQIANVLKGNATTAKRLDAAARIQMQYKDSFEKILGRPGYSDGIDMDDFDQYLEAIGQKDANRQQMADFHKELVENTLILLRAIKDEQPEDKIKVLKFIPFATDENIEIAEKCNGKTPQEIKSIVEGIRRRHNLTPPEVQPEKEELNFCKIVIESEKHGVKCV